jgi:16S rRNA (cytosine1402-N4)-methyltransferase
MHISVLLEESLKYLNLKEDSKVVDMTLGYGGHSSEILKRIKKGFLFAFDQDSDAILFSNEKLSKLANNYKIIKSNFVNIKEELNKLDINGVDAILFDLGVSSPQLDQKERGFSFHQDAYLDMRMDKEAKLDAHYIVNNYTYEQLIKIFYTYGEEKFSSSIAKNIIKHREQKAIDTTLELVEIIKNSVPERYKREKHPARKIFQALRIEVNNELAVFKKALEDSLEMLNVNGRICVITFHSLEDKICKEIFKKNTAIDKAFKDLPIVPELYLPKFKIVKTIEPSDQELDDNNRSRSAKLRVIERTKE